MATATKEQLQTHLQIMRESSAYIAIMLHEEPVSGCEYTARLPYDDAAPESAHMAVYRAMKIAAGELADRMDGGR
jgi:hypothetical protein